MKCLPCRAAAIALAALLGACASTTTVTLSPPSQAAICELQPTLIATVLWQTAWRPDQKDVEQREAAAAQGMTRFFSETRCFQTTSLARTDARPSAFSVPQGSDLLLVLTLRELGPTVKLLSSAALLEGGTEVVVDVAQYRPGRKEPERLFTITWRDGGPGVVKGVKSLPDDLVSALKAGLQAR